jgi:hypothetical protein
MNGVRGPGSGVREHSRFHRTFLVGAALVAARGGGLQCATDLAIWTTGGDKPRPYTVLRSGWGAEARGLWPEAFVSRVACSPKPVARSLGGWGA